MALTYINSASAAATSVAIPTHQVGDIIVVYAYRDGSTTAPTKPTAGGTVPAWADTITAPAGNTNSARLCHFTATATTTTTGSWTNATGIAVVVLRGHGASSPVGGSAVQAGTSSVAVVAPDCPLVTDNGTSQILHFYGHRTVTAWSSAPAGTTRRTSVATEVCVNTKDDSTAGTGNTQSCTTSASSGRLGVSVEILADQTYSGPSVATRNSGTAASLSGASLNMPSGITAGDLLVAYVASANDSGSTTLTASGWTKLGAIDGTGGTNQSAVFHKTAVGGDTCVISGTGAGSYVTYRILSAGSPVGTSAAAGSGAPDPPAHTGLASGDYLALALGHSQAAALNNTVPTGFHDLIRAGSSEPFVGAAEREFSAVTSINPGAFSGGAGVNTAWTIAIPASSATTYEKTGSGCAAAAGSGPKTVTPAATHTKAGSAARVSAASGPKAVTSATTYTKTGSAAAVTAATGTKSVERVKAGSAAPVAAGSGPKAVASATGYEKTGSGAAALAGSGTQVLAPATTYVRTGSAAASACASGTKAVISSGTIEVEGGAFGTAAASGTTVVVSATTHEKSGAGCATGAGSGPDEVTPAAVHTKTGGGIASRIADGTKVVIPPVEITKTGGSFAQGLGLGVSLREFQKLGGSLAALCASGPGLATAQVAAWPPTAGSITISRPSGTTTIGRPTASITVELMPTASLSVTQADGEVTVPHGSGTITVP